MLNAWENAWNSAQPHLSSITTAIRPSATVNPRVIRVGQLDSELLDQQLVQLLQEPINKALSLIDVTICSRICFNFSLCPPEFTKSQV